MLSRRYFDKTVWSGLCEIPSHDIKYYGWIPKPKETTRAVKNKNKNVYKLLQVARDLPDILHEIVTLLDNGIFCGAQLFSFQSDTVFSLQHTIKLVSYLQELQQPFGHQVKSKTSLFYLHQDASYTKERSFSDLISHIVNNYYRNCPINIDTASREERATKIKEILKRYFANFVEKLVLLAVSGNYSADFKLHHSTPFEYGSWAIYKLVEDILGLIETQNNTL
jgi:hypothetical protein